MELQIDEHTLTRAEERGTNINEIRDVIETGSLIPAKYQRLCKYKIYSFNKERNGKYYKQKRVEVYYIGGVKEIITVTVYVFYGEWEN